MGQTPSPFFLLRPEDLPGSLEGLPSQAPWPLCLPDDAFPFFRSSGKLEAEALHRVTGLCMCCAHSGHEAAGWGAGGGLQLFPSG